MSSYMDKLRFSLDSGIVSGGRFFASGWVFHFEESVLGVDLEIETSSGVVRFPTQYRQNRPDVSEAFDRPDALQSGFWCSGSLSGEEILSSAFVIKFFDTEEVRVTISNGGEIWKFRHPKDTIQSDETIGFGKINFTRSGLRRHFNYLKQGRLRPLLSAIKYKLSSIDNSKTSVSQAWLGDLLRERNLDLPDAVPDGQDEITYTQNMQFISSSLRDHKVALILDHGLGGGANKYRDQKIHALHDDNKLVLLVYYIPSTLSYTIEVSGPEFTYKAEVENLQALLTCDKPLFAELHLNNIYSFPDPESILMTLRQIKLSNSSVELLYYLHDYFSICPSYTLLDSNGLYCAVPNVAKCQSCLPNHSGDFASFYDVSDITEWRRKWGAFLEVCDQILTFSEASKRILQQAYPLIDGEVPILVQPHKVTAEWKSVPKLDLERELNIGVVGSLTESKGVKVVADLARLLSENSLPAQITIIGSANERMPTDKVTITGVYSPEELPGLIEKHSVNLLFFPSIWPETFSYVVSELILMEVPLACFDVGAPAERVKPYPSGKILSCQDPGGLYEELQEFHFDYTDAKRRKNQKELKAV